MKRKKIKSVWKEYLTLTMRERRGLSILLLILLFQLSFLFYLNSVDLDYPFADFTTVKKLQAELEKIEPIKSYESNFRKTTLYLFNPNLANDSDWINFGLSEKQAHSVYNYLKKGGSFKLKKDVKKIYGMNDQLYADLIPFIDLPDSFQRKVYEKRNFEKPHFEKLDLNEADTIQLEKLRGIGVKLASRIVKYRNSLGGFISIDQLKEVWGLNDTLFELVEKQVQLKSNSDIRYLYLNKDSFEVFSKHPYVGKKLAGLIVKYREQHQRFNNTEELKNLPLLTDEIFRKLAAYLKLE